MKLGSILPLIFLGLICVSHAASRPGHLVFIGTTSADGPDTEQGIYSLRLDPINGQLTGPKMVAKAATNPAFLAMSPDGQRLYATVVLPEPINGMKGGVSAFAIHRETGGLTLLNTQPTLGNLLAHLAVDATGRALVVANYGSGSVGSFALSEDGRVGHLRSLVSWDGGSGVNPQRQRTPCPHAVVISPDNRQVFVPALGQDKIVKFNFDAAAATIALADPAAHTSAPGAGPRHAKFSPDGKFFYALNELNGSVDVLAYDAAGEKLTPVQTVSGLPADFTGQNQSAEIRIHPTGRFVYTSNRGHDSIAEFSRDPATGRLTRLGNVSSGGRHPRNFALSPDGNWVLCANRDTNNLVVFFVDQTTGRLTPTGASVEVPGPICVLFAD